mgnify:CR=1 FL=1
MGNFLLNTFTEGVLAAGGLRGLLDKFFSDWILPVIAIAGFVIIIGTAIITRSLRQFATVAFVVIIALLLAFMVKSASGNDCGKLKSTGEDWGNAFGVVAPAAPGGKP